MRCGHLPRCYFSTSIILPSLNNCQASYGSILFKFPCVDSLNKKHETPASSYIIKHFIIFLTLISFSTISKSGHLSSCKSWGEDIRLFNVRRCISSRVILPVSGKWELTTLRKSPATYFEWIKGCLRCRQMDHTRLWLTSFSLLRISPCTCFFPRWKGPHRCRQHRRHHTRYSFLQICRKVHTRFLPHPK